MALEYKDPETGLTIITNSMLKTMRRCPKQFDYKYVQRLKPRVGSKPLERGKWLHSLLEAYYLTKRWEYAQANPEHGEMLTGAPPPPTWEEVHDELTEKYRDLFDEEREALGDLPKECRRLFKSYLWHYSNDDSWIIHEVEWTVDVTLGKKFLYRGRADMLVENELGLWLVDHKSHKTLPNHLQRLLDSQSALYLWAVRKMGIPVQGFIWNYLKTKPPTIPELVYQGKPGERLSKRGIDTDYLTYAGAIKRYGIDPAPYRPELRRLKSQRFDPNGTMQTSPFFLRITMEKDDDFLQQIAREAMTTAQRADTTDWTRQGWIERVPDRSCGYMCSYTDLCAAELFGGNADNIRRQMFKIGDPLDYYKEKADHTEQRD